MRPIAENDRFAIWRLSAAGGADMVLDKDEGRWALGTGIGARTEGDDETRQSRMAEMAAELGLELTDGSPAVAPSGPALGM